MKGDAHHHSSGHLQGLQTRPLKLASASVHAGVLRLWRKRDWMEDEVWRIREQDNGGLR